MQELSIIINNETKTMSSLDIVAIINQYRKNTNDDTVLRHDHFLVKCKEVIGDELTQKFGATYKASNGKENPCYQLPKRETMLMLMSYSYELQALVYDRWQELENANKPALPATYLEALKELVVKEEALLLANTQVSKLEVKLDLLLDWVSIIKVAKHNKVKETVFNWRELKKASKKLGYEIKTAESPRFGYQNLYHINCFKHCYPQYNYKINNKDII
jgi:phage regulator Rha-like protein